MMAKVGMVQREEMAIARQEHDKHVSATAETDATDDELLPMRPFVALALRTSFRSNESTRNNTR
jgi:hypothetical protein